MWGRLTSETRKSRSVGGRGLICRIILLPAFAVAPAGKPAPIPLLPAGKSSSPYHFMSSFFKKYLYVYSHFFGVTTIKTGLSVSSNESAIFLSSPFFKSLTFIFLKSSPATYFFSVIASTNENSLPPLQ